MLEIALEGLEFYAYHGYYEEERKIGNFFSVDIKVKTELYEFSDSENLSNTINYEHLYTIAQEEMSIPRKLLETIANNITDKVFSSLPEVKEMEVSISKYNPPFGGQCKKAKVSLSRKR